MNILKEFDSILARSVEPIKVDNISFDLQKLKELFKTRFSESFINFKNELCIYRGHRKLNKEIAILTPGKRASQNTANYYTILMSYLLPSWKDFPKRDSSFICTTSEYKARDYALDKDDLFDKDDLYHVFPENGANLGICSASDIWDSCSIQLSYYFDRYDDLLDFNEAILELYLGMLNYLNIKIKDKNNILQTPEDFIEFEKIYVQIMDRMVYLYDRSDNFTKEEKIEFDEIKLIFSTPMAVKLSNEYIDDTMPLLKKLDYDLLNAKVNRNQFCRIKDMPREAWACPSFSREVWTDAPCLFISASTMEKLINQNILDKWFEGR